MTAPLVLTFTSYDDRKWELFIQAWVDDSSNIRAIDITKSRPWTQHAPNKWSLLYHKLVTEQVLLRLGAWFAFGVLATDSCEIAGRWLIKHQMGLLVPILAVTLSVLIVRLAPNFLDSITVWFCAVMSFISVIICNKGFSFSLRIAFTDRQRGDVQLGE